MRWYRVTFPARTDIAVSVAAVDEQDAAKQAADLLDLEVSDAVVELTEPVS